MLGLDGEGLPGNDRKRWRKALRERKGTGLSGRASMSIDIAKGGESVGGSSGRQSSEKAIGDAP